MSNPFINDEIFENLPELIKESVNAFSGRERDVVLLSSLGVLSCCLPTVFGNYNGKNHSPHLYVFIIAPPASGKSRMELSSIIIEKIHQHVKTTSKKAIDDCKKNDKSNFSNCPKIEVKLIPGDVSSAKVYTHLESSVHGLLIFESEADSLSQSLKQDYGNFSHMLRKAFHHEKISVSRAIDDKYIEVNKPRLAIVLSGTLGQIKPLIESKENGLFSRFIYYYFDEIIGWKDVSPREHSIDYELLFNQVGDEVCKMYGRLANPELEGIEFKLTDDQWVRLNELMKVVTQMIIKNIDNSFIASAKRMGLIFFRLCMILSAIRNKDVLYQNKEFVCEDIDFDIAEILIKNLLDHSISVFELFEEEKLQLTMLQMNVLEKLPRSFKRQEAIAAGDSFGVPVRTMDYNLRKWVENKVLRKVSNGIYSKK